MFFSDASIIMIVLIIMFGTSPLLFSQTKSDSLRISLKNASGDAKILILNDLAELLLESNLNESITLAEQALYLSQSKENLSRKTRAERIIADAWYYKNDFLKAIDFYKASAKTELELNGNFSKNHQNRLSDVGYCYLMLAFYDKADEYFTMALRIAQTRKDVEEIANNLNNLGQTAFGKGEYSVAISYFDQTLKLDRERQIDEYISIDLNNIGKVYYSWGKYNQALNYYREALEIAVNIGKENLQAVRLSNIGQVYESMDSYDTAINYFNKALEIDQRLGNTGKVGIRLSNIGLVYLKQQKFDESRQKLSEALLIFDKNKNMASKIITLNHMGDLMLIQKRYEEALVLFAQSIHLSEKYGMKTQQMRSAKSISDIHRQQHDFENALNYYLKYNEIKDSVFNYEKHRQLAEFEARYEIEKKEKENELLRQDAKIQRKQKIIIIISGIALLFLAVSFIILFYFKRKSLIQNNKLHEKEIQLHQFAMDKKEKENHHLQNVLFAEAQINKLQTEKLQQKNRELSTATVHILNKNEVLGNIRKLTTDWMTDDKFNKTTCLPKLIREVDNNTDLDEQWDQFKMHFESVHKGFFKRLMQTHPNLTQNDLKLCAYLRMNLSTKEIAQMLNISPESVTTKRYRLRKKLGLEKEENLVGFIGGF